jgi:hypothetical protein
MKKTLLILSLIAICGILPAQTKPWVTNYYAAWDKWNSVPVDIPDLDFTTGTHWVLFTRGPHSDGTFDTLASGNPVDQAFVLGAHSAGAKAILGTGGFGSDYTGPVTNIQKSVAFLAALVNKYGYDGIDIDWEPVPSAQYTNFSAWVQALKNAIPNLIITVAGFNFDQALVNNRNLFDQINLMTYDMSGSWCSVSWHNSALYGDDPTKNTFSIDGMVNKYIAAGVPASKLGFGIELYAYIWNGVTGPNQTGWGTIQNTVPYWTIMQSFYNMGATLKYDTLAQSAYFSTFAQFVSMGGMESDLPARAAYVKSKGLGGVIVYEAGVGRVPDETPPDRIMKQVKAAFLGGPSLPPLPYIAPPPPPSKKSYVVYDNAVQPPWTNISWITKANGVDEAAVDPTNTSNKVVSVQYSAWDGLRYYTGPWGNQPYVASDTLSFDMYPSGSAFTVTVMIEGLGAGRTFSGPMNSWTHIKTPCPPVAFSWFYLQNNTANQNTVLFDNIKFTAGADTVPPPPPPPPPPVDTTWKVGDTVYTSTTSCVNVRSIPAVAGSTILKCEPNGTRGVLISGPTIDSASYTFWKVTFSDGITGWAAVNFLAKKVVVVPPPSVTRIDSVKVYFGGKVQVLR